MRGLRQKGRPLIGRIVYLAGVMLSVYLSPFWRDAGDFISLAVAEAVRWILLAAYTATFALMLAIFYPSKPRTAIRAVMGEILASLSSSALFALAFSLLSASFPCPHEMFRIVLTQCAFSVLWTVSVHKFNPSQYGPVCVLRILESPYHTRSAECVPEVGERVIRTVTLDEYRRNPAECLALTDEVLLCGVKNGEREEIIQDCAKLGIAIFLLP